MYGRIISPYFDEVIRGILEIYAMEKYAINVAGEQSLVVSNAHYHRAL